MFKKIILAITFIFGISLIITYSCYAFRLLTEEKAIRSVFGENVEVITETRELVDPGLSSVKEILGGRLLNYQKGSKSKKIAETTSFTFYFALKNGEKTGVAIMDTEPGKWGPIEFIIALDLNGAVTKVAVMNYREKRGRPIARKSFMRQFIGKTSGSSLKVRRDITGITGATISSKSAAFAVKKAIALYEHFYMKQ